MATVVRCDICGSISDDQDYNFESIIRCNTEFDICEECINKIRDFCSDINTNYKKILDNILENDVEKGGDLNGT